MLGWVAESRLLAVPESGLAADHPELRKARGAFFTPAPIADFLAAWAVGGDPAARIPTRSTSASMALTSIALR